VYDARTLRITVTRRSYLDAVPESYRGSMSYSDYSFPAQLLSPSQVPLGPATATHAHAGPDSFWKKNPLHITCRRGAIELLIPSPAR